MSSTHCSAPRVAALALQTLNALYTRPSILKVENLMPSLWQIKLERPVRNLPWFLKLLLKTNRGKNVLAWYHWDRKTCP